MSILYIEGAISPETFPEICFQHHLDPKSVVFLFPGNVSHHKPGTTLYTVKSGGGLAAVAMGLGKLGYATLSLPTTTMEQWESNETQQKVVQLAIEDLYRALGAGYNLMLPVRKHESERYFDQGLTACNGKLEPSFWGGIQAAANKPLANHYIKALNRLHQFTSKDKSTQTKEAQQQENDAFMAAYLAGTDEGC